MSYEKLFRKHFANDFSKILGKKSLFSENIQPTTTAAGKPDRTKVECNCGTTQKKKENEPCYV